MDWNRGPSGYNLSVNDLDATVFSGADQSKLATLIRLLLIIAGIEINPGPTPRWPCDVCQKSAARNSIECVICRKWQYLKCAEVTPAEYHPGGSAFNAQRNGHAESAIRAQPTQASDVRSVSTGTT